MRRNALSVFVIMLSFVFVLFGCGKTADVKGSSSPSSETAQTKSSNSSAEKKQPDTVTVGMAKLAGSAPIYVAIDKGFFKEENIDIQYKWFESSNAINVATASNNIDIGATGLSADLYNMIASGQKVSIIADKGREQKGYRLSAIVVLKDSPIQKIEDLKGKKIGVTTIGSSHHYMTGRILEKHGMTMKDIELVPLTTIRAQVEALKGKQVEAVLLLSSNIAAAEQEGYGRVLANVADEISYQSTAIIASSKFLSNNDVALRFMRGYIKGMRYYYDAVLVQKDGKVVKGQNYDEVVKIVAKYTEQPTQVIEQSFPYMDRDGKLQDDDIQTQIDWYAKEKLVTKKPDPKDFVNTELQAEAVKSLGK
jgi:NitT/TauT family transport system substrate-binding protein